ncbi:MAG: hypothetical protein KDA25_10725 [Phycisphaerales bacterium]|nr:hypothetical protein [Phycisphaerales bacterium]
MVDERPDSDAAGVGTARLDRAWCAACGYDLRGREARGDCPECGAPYTADTIVRRLMPGPVEILFVTLWPVVILIPIAMSFGWTMLTQIMTFVTVLNLVLAASWLAARRKGNFKAAAGWRRGARAIVYTLGGLLLLLIALVALLMWSCGQLFP